jgi:hypothetical protein
MVLFIFDALEDVKSRPCRTLEESNLPWCDRARCFVYAIANFNSNFDVTSSSSIGANADDVAPTIQVESAVNSRVPPVGLASSDYETFITHPVKIDHRVFTSASTGESIVSSDIVALYLSTVSATTLGQKLAKQYYLRGNIKIKIVIQGQPFAAGQVVAYFRPHVFTPDSYTQVASLNNSLVGSKIMPHLILDPSKTTTYELTLPVVSTSGYWTLRGDNLGSWRMAFTVFNALVTGTAVAPTMSVCTYMSFEAPTLHGTTLLSAPFQSEKGGRFSSVFKAGAQFATSVGSSFPNISPATTLFSTVVGTAGDILALLGFAKPPQIVNEAKILNRHVDNYSQFDGQSSAIVLAGTQQNSVGLSASYGGGLDAEMLLKNVYSKKGYLFTSTITQAMAADAVVVRFPVTPLLSYSPASQVYEPTPLGGCAAPFAFWKGDLEYTFEFVSTVFHRCTILIAWDPLRGSVDPTLADALQTLQNTTVMIAGNESVEVTVPWRQSRVWCETGQITATTATSSFSLHECNGQFHIYVINPVTANGSTDGIYMNVYVRGVDVKFACPVADRVALYEYTETLLSAPFCPSTKVSFGSGTSMEGAELASFGEEYLSVKQLTSKLTLLWDTDFSVAAADSGKMITYGFANVPFPMTTGVTVATTYMNFLSWFSASYMGYRGSLRHVYHVHSFEAANSLGTLYWMYNNLSQGLVTGELTLGTSNSPGITTGALAYAFSGTNKAICPNSEFVAPMLNNYDFYPTRFRISTCLNNVSVEIPTNTNALSQNFSATFLRGSGDDASFVFFLGFPLVTIAN